MSEYIRKYGAFIPYFTFIYNSNSISILLVPDSYNKITLLIADYILKTFFALSKESVGIIVMNSSQMLRAGIANNRQGLNQPLPHCSLF